MPVQIVTEHYYREMALQGNLSHELREFFFPVLKRIPLEGYDSLIEILQT